MTPDTIENARRLYENSHFDNESIAKQVGCGGSSVSTWSRKFGWSRTEDYIPHSNPDEKRQAKDLYENTEIPIIEIAATILKSPSTIKAWVSRYGWTSEYRKSKKKEYQKRFVKPESVPHPAKLRNPKKWPKWANFYGMEIGLSELQQEDNDARQAFDRFLKNVRHVG